MKKRSMKKRSTTPKSQSTARTTAGVAAVLINLAMIVVVAMIWLNWSEVVRPMPIWEMVLWAIPLGGLATLGETLAMYAWSGRWA